MLSRAGQILLAGLVTSAYWALSRTWFFRHVNRPRAQGPIAYAHWHGDELLMVGGYVGSGMAVMASRSKDGELMGRVLGWLGYFVVRGSSSRGGAGGLKGLIDSMKKDGRISSLAVDGPRGPIYKAKPGILKLAQETGSPIVAAASAASRRFVFKKAWNRCYFPLPFSRCVIVYGEPFEVPKNATSEDFQILAGRLERELNSLRAEAERVVHKSRGRLISAGCSAGG